MLFVVVSTGFTFLACGALNSKHTRLMHLESNVMGSPTENEIQIAEGVVTERQSDGFVDVESHDVDPREERAFVRAPVTFQ